MIAGGVYAEIKQAHIVLLFFEYFGDLLSLIIIGVVCGGVVSKSQIHISVNTHKDKSKQLEQNKKRTRRIGLGMPRQESTSSISTVIKFSLPLFSILLTLYNAYLFIIYSIYRISLF